MSDSSRTGFSGRRGDVLARFPIRLVGDAVEVFRDDLLSSRKSVASAHSEIYVRSDRVTFAPGQSWMSALLLRSLSNLFRTANPEVVQISYSEDMDHLLVLREKIGRLREEIAEIQRLNEQSRRDGMNGTDPQVAHGQRNERLQAIQQELIQLGNLGRKVVSTEQMREKHRTRLHLVNKRAS